MGITCGGTAFVETTYPRDWSARIVQRLVELEQPGMEAFQPERDALRVQFDHIVTGARATRAPRRPALTRASSA